MATIFASTSTDADAVEEAVLEAATLATEDRRLDATEERDDAMDDAAVEEATDDTEEDAGTHIPPQSAPPLLGSHESSGLSTHSYPGSHGNAAIPPHIIHDDA